MKKIINIVIVVALLVIAYFQYSNYRRFHPPVDYDYEANAEIDVNYHDQPLVFEYYSKIFEVGAFARSMWRNESIDVRFPDASSEMEKNAANHYNAMLTRIQFIEGKLMQSKRYKDVGHSNEEIQQIESGVPPLLAKAGGFEPMLNVQFGDTGAPVWEIQKQLIGKGYEHQLDGLFGIDTQNALTAFQRDQDIFPSGQIDTNTLIRLFLE